MSRKKKSPNLAPTDEPPMHDWVEVESAAPTPTPAPAPAPKPPKPAPPPKAETDAVTLRVFCTAFTKHQDQLAGFQRYAKNSRMKPRSMRNWRKAYEQFRLRPVK